MSEPSNHRIFLTVFILISAQCAYKCGNAFVGLQIRSCKRTPGAKHLPIQVFYKYVRARVFYQKNADRRCECVRYDYKYAMITRTHSSVAV